MLETTVAEGERFADMGEDCCGEESRISRFDPVSPEMGYDPPHSHSPRLTTWRLVAAYFGRRGRYWARDHFSGDPWFPIRPGRNENDSSISTYKEWIDEWLMRRIERDIQHSQRFRGVIAELRRRKGLPPKPADTPSMIGFRAIPRPAENEGPLVGSGEISQVIGRVDENTGRVVPYNEQYLAVMIRDGNFPVTTLLGSGGKRGIPITYNSVIRTFM